MRTAAVIGWPIEHSKSPAMLNAAFAATGIDAEMIKVGVPPEHFAAKLTELRALPMLGASVTTPHKLAAHDLCDELSPAARAIGAVNCLQLVGLRLVGHNTDAPGFVDAVTAAGIELAGARVVVLGAGGAARAVAYGCSEAGALVDIVARTPANVAWTAAHPWSSLAGLFGRAQLVVDCTSSGLADGALDVPLDALASSATVATLVYHARTDLLERASERGHSTLDGGAMLLHQGARAFTLWTGGPAPLDAMAA
ncbi:MAG TPA: shikimate dehydrogenase, partial [Kofleriaceae bacterium]|nr:shikimate dehydrogenase [Kofleriaceae bacterium]